jgi:hypothetical protein
MFLCSMRVLAVYSMVYFRAYHFTRLYRTSEKRTPPLVRYNEGLLCVYNVLSASLAINLR